MSRASVHPRAEARRRGQAFSGFRTTSLLRLVTLTWPLWQSCTFPDYRVTTTDGRTSQKWLPVPQVNGSHLFVNALSSKCADVRDRSIDDGGVVQQYVCNGGDNQRWFLSEPL